MHHYTHMSIYIYICIQTYIEYIDMLHYPPIDNQISHDMHEFMTAANYRDHKNPSDDL